MECVSVRQRMECHSSRRKLLLNIRSDFKHVAETEFVPPCFCFIDRQNGSSIPGAFCTSLYRRSDFNTIGGYDENMKHGLEDWELWIRLLKTGGEVIHTSKCQFYYRIKEESRNSDLYRDDSKVNEAYNYIFKKHLASYEVSNSVELYKKYSNTKHELDNLHLFLSFKEIFKLFLKKVQNILFKVVKRVKRGDS